MPIPFLVPGAIAAVSAIAAAVGVGSGAKGIKKNKQAKNINAEAQSTFDKAKAAAEHARERSDKSLERLGRTKLNVLNQSMNHFVAVFDQIHNVRLKDTVGMDELSKFHLDKQGLIEIRKLGNMATSAIGGVVGGAAAGALTAFGAYSATMTFAAASTGTAIASLSGVAATNATLAFLGGGSLAAGGGGMALGSTILGGAVAGPAIAILGVVINASANKNLDNAYSNKYKAEEAVEGLAVVYTLCNGIAKRSDMFTSLISKLDEILVELTTQLEEIVNTRGTDFSCYDEKERGIVAMSMSVAAAIKKVLDTPILTESGELTSESETVHTEIKRYIKSIKLADTRISI